MIIKYYQKCGNKLEEGFELCPKCGTQINKSSQSNTNLKKRTI
ncbi:zinc-ribbon domain-containing protein [Apilactobacillus kunkeei]|nr:zinc-ribbon domain-containing protein [Apilactobacillus kunkeei]